MCCQNLRTTWSKQLGALAQNVFITSIPAQSELSAQHCEELWSDLEQELAAQLQQAECTTKLQLEAMTAQLDKDEKVVNLCCWIISNILSIAFNAVSLSHVSFFSVGME